VKFDDLTKKPSTPIVVLLGLTLLSLVPAILLTCTSFTKILVVLGLTRNALGLQQIPPNQVLVGLALFLTFFVMSPVITQVNDTAYQPFVKGEITQQVALGRAMVSVREFMLRQTYDKDLTLFANLDKIEKAADVSEIPDRVVIPAFITSEIKRAFQIGFFIYIPFIIIDMIVSSTLMSMGMMMLPPTAISLPFKVLLFVLLDGWGLTIKTLIMSFK
jgi:flagellar biosynthetic protein FliP